MSLLNSVLSSIGGEQAPSAPSTTSQSTTRKPAQPPKKGDINTVPSKTLRKDNLPPVKSTTNTLPRAPASSAAITPQSTKPAAPIPYRGTARANATPATISTAPRPLSKPSTPGAASVANPAAGTSTVPAAAGKKTGYAAVLERAKAAQQAQQSIGAIKHRPVEKMSRKERLGKELEVKKTASSIKLAKGGNSNQNRALTPTTKASDVAKDKRKPLDLGYKGTMRTAEPAYKGTMKGPSASRTPVNPPKAKGVRSAEYTRYSDDDLDDEEEEEEDYKSDASSDMEAAAWDLEAEEQASLRAARKEDDAALKEESELKRQKDDRKRRLAELVAANAAKKKRF